MPRCSQIQHEYDSITLLVMWHSKPIKKHFPHSNVEHTCPMISMFFCRDHILKHVPASCSTLSSPSVARGARGKSNQDIGLGGWLLKRWLFGVDGKSVVSSRISLSASFTRPKRSQFDRISIPDLSGCRASFFKLPHTSSLNIHVLEIPGCCDWASKPWNFRICSQLFQFTIILVGNSLQ